mmetsp:Transcript_45078/g.119620  ORF Transcript_45078/g.119620 Transcript_45078/m.119620 type:complete len:136 (+) Transcript_45078:803-1210(+)
MHQQDRGPTSPAQIGDKAIEGTRPAVGVTVHGDVTEVYLDGLVARMFWTLGLATRRVVTRGLEALGETHSLGNTSSGRPRGEGATTECPVCMTLVTAPRNSSTGLKITFARPRGEEGVTKTGGPFRRNGPVNSSP